MKQTSCYVCGKSNITKDEIGLSRKLLDVNKSTYYCLSCLAEYLDVDEEMLLQKIEEFKEQGCIYF